MTDILLIYPPYTYPKKSPPIGLGYIAAVLEKEGHSVKILDMSVLNMNCQDVKMAIEKDKPKIVGISFMTNQYKEAVNVAGTIKGIDENIKIIAGGPHVSALPGEALSTGLIDIAVIGEGERTMSELVTNLLNDETDKLETINGIAYKKDNRIHVTHPREYISDLDSVAYPAWHLLPVDKYAVPATGGDTTKPVFAVISSRGCPNHCIFCDSNTIFGRKFRARSARNIFDELMYLNKRFGATQFDFVDDTITVNKNRIYELCNLMIENNSQFSWMCNARVNTVNPDMLKLMKKAGCVRVEFGVESGNPEILKKIKKEISIEQIKKAHAMARDAGLSIGSFVMVGNVGEDFSSVIQTKNLLEALETDDIYIAIATPFPGTELYKIARDNNWIRTYDWSEYVVSPTYLPNYQPIMHTDSMNLREIMESFFYLHSKFVKKKFKTRYGQHFYMNTKFYKETVFNIHSVKELKHKFKMGAKLVGSYISR